MKNNSNQTNLQTFEIEKQIKLLNYKITFLCDLIKEIQNMIFTTFIFVFIVIIMFAFFKKQ